MRQTDFETAENGTDMARQTVGGCRQVKEVAGRSLTLKLILKLIVTGVALPLLFWLGYGTAEAQQVAAPNAQSGQVQSRSGSGTTEAALSQTAAPQANQANQAEGQPSQFDAQAAFEHLKSVCAIGPRVSASPGMRKQQEYIEAHFKSIGGKFYTQPFRTRSPYTGQLVQLDNIIIQFHPKRKKRLLICCHYDTRPFPDSDPVNPRGVFIGANDGGSGVALLCELGRHVQAMDGDFGVDLVFFDGEEFVIQRQRDKMFLGSTYFAQQYADGKFNWEYSYGILVDMVGDKDLQIYLEGNSLGFADGLTRSVWTVAKELGVKEFIPEQRHRIKDDHLPLNSIARIQTVDIIDFDYPNTVQGNSYWHTQKDTIENCSAESLGKVGSVVLEWLRQIQRLNKGR